MSEKANINESKEDKTIQVSSIGRHLVPSTYTEPKKDTIQLSDIGRRLISSMSIEFGSLQNDNYQKITYKPCKKCGEIMMVEDVAKGYITMTNSDKQCDKCFWRTLFGEKK